VWVVTPSTASGVCGGCETLLQRWVGGWRADAPEPGTPAAPPWPAPRRWREPRPARAHSTRVS
jgi:hypothetical protein